MPEIAYTVLATLPDAKLAEEWLGWLRGGHIADVLAGGAMAAEIVSLNDPELRFEIRYRFPSQEAFDHYEKEVAPRLRAEGLQRFPPERGISYKRSVGIVSDVFPKKG